jgi:hypothetical protein
MVAITAATISSIALRTASDARLPLTICAARAQAPPGQAVLPGGDDLVLYLRFGVPFRGYPLANPVPGDQQAGQLRSTIYGRF